MPMLDGPGKPDVPSAEAPQQLFTILGLQRMNALCAMLEASFYAE